MRRFALSLRILIVDDHEVVRHGVRAVILKSKPDWEVCGEATNGKEAIQAVITLNPDVVLLDVTMPVMSGLEAASRIAKLGLGCRVLIFTMHQSERLLVDVREAGAHGFVQKAQVARDLILAIESVVLGGTFFGGQTKSEAGNELKPSAVRDTSLC
jgi:DNA-binding NarL/FixJ family response regulator